jgi:pantothenate synthetase
MAPVARIDEEVLAVVAARLGSVRLIDNAVIETAAPDGNGNGTASR